MKKFIAISILFGFGLMISLNSCKKKEEETTPAALTSTATLKGNVKAVLNATNTDEEFAPSGTKLIVTINSADLVDDPIPNYSYKTLTYEATVDGSGNYSFSIPAGSQIFSVKLNGVDFTYDQTIWDPSNPGSTTTERKVYTVPQTTVSIQAGDIKINDLYYN